MLTAYSLNNNDSAVKYSRICIIYSFEKHNYLQEKLQVKLQWHNKIMKLIKPSPTIFLFFLLSACGGSGGNDTTSPVVTNPPEIPTQAQPITSLSFTDIAITNGLQFSSEFSASYVADPSNYAGGAASGDIDGDGDIDLFITRGDTQANLLFINNAGSFTENTNSALAFPNKGTANYKLSGPTFADMDGDKDLDLFIGGLDGDPSFVFANDGNGVFTNVTTGSGIDTMNSENTLSAAFGDYDKDGDLDLALAHWGTARDSMNPGETETLWRNDSDATGIKFTAVSLASGIAESLDLNLSGVLNGDRDYTFAPNFADVNNDSYPDLLSVSDFKGSKIFINNQDGTFSDVTDDAQINDDNGMGAAVGDYDNDGNLDWFVSSIDGNRLYNNSAGTGILSNNTESTNIASGGWGWGSCFADFDLDGLLDIYQTNGWVNDDNATTNNPYTTDTSRLWMQNNSGNFSNLATETFIEDNQQGRAVVCADFDNDRDVDVLLLLNEDNQAAILWNNNLATKNSISVLLRGPSPNTQAIGARIYVTIDTTTQMREVAIGSNFTSHNPTAQIFGLGDAPIIDELKIVWPDSTEIVQNNVIANQDLIFTHVNF